MNSFVIGLKIEQSVCLLLEKVREVLINVPENLHVMFKLFLTYMSRKVQ